MDSVRTMRASVTTTSSGPSLSVIVMCLFFAFIIVICILVIILKVVANNHIKKNNKTYFDLNKDLCTKCKKKGQLATNFIVVYKDYIDYFGFNREIRCSRSVVSNSELNEVKYVIKYSNIDYSVDSMERLETISKFFKGYEKFLTEMDDAGSRIKKTLPFPHKLFANRKKIMYLLCDLDYEITKIKLPYIYFLYISSAGRSSYGNKIVLGTSLIDMIVGEISETINKKGHSRHQRSIMTSDLRDAIKKRDNYTCCKCGNSVYKEPNLLLEVDHIVPVSKGGKTEASNLQTLCWRCNREKGNKE